MDKERIFFLVSESRIIDYSTCPDDEDMLRSAKDAICLGDRILKIIEVDISIGLPDSNSNESIIVKIVNETDISKDSKLEEMFNLHKLELQKEVWETMPEGVYRLNRNKLNVDKIVAIEYCPNISDEQWNQIEIMGWKRSR